MEAVRRIWSKPSAWLPLLPFALWLAFSLFRDGFHLSTLIVFGGAMLFFAASLYIGVCVARPLRSYLAAALGSVGLAALLLFLAASVSALLFWLALTALGFAWAWYWERSEPLPTNP